MTDNQLDKDRGAPEKNLLKRKRKRHERLLMGVAILVILGLTVLQSRVVNLGEDVPEAWGLLIFLLTNFNIILLFLLLVLVLRNLYKIFFEEKQVFSGNLRTKLVVAFISLSLVPAVLLFYSGIQFIATGHDYWFDENVERSLVDSLVLGQYLSDVSERFTYDFGDRIKQGLVQDRLYRENARPKLEKFLAEKRREYHLFLIKVLTPNGEPVATSKGPEVVSDPKPLPQRLFQEAAEKNQPRSWVDAKPNRDLIRVVWPLTVKGEGLAGFLVVGYQTAAPIKEKMQAVDKGLKRYLELKKLHDPIRVSQYIALTIVALLSIFVSTWIGFHLAKSITGPIMELAQATDRISHGDYDFAIDVKTKKGEIATLVSSFNRMTRDLKAGETKLVQSNLELDKRRRYMETVLQNIAAGVISISGDGLVTTVNNSAEEILQIRADDILGRPYTNLLAPEQRDFLEDMLKSTKTSPKGSAEKQTRIKIAGKGISLNINLTQLKDEDGHDLGLVMVLDDLSDLEKAQRMAAWREVARRIAHEIKNPLTPIQLSTQRLRKRYEGKIEEGDQLFDECTLMIIRQVDELKRLVGEFSNFARMPEANPTPNDLGQIVEEALVLYQDNQKEIKFVFNRDPSLPVFNLDRVQIGRAVINLLDNAVAAVDEQGRIEITLNYNRLLKMAQLEVADDGIGLSRLDKERLFEPYYSNKKSGTGLGLAIVSTIVADHDGFVRVQENQPRGARFIIELPVKS